jgi:transcriptional regulator with XRE-family HTH domain
MIMSVWGRLAFVSSGHSSNIRVAALSRSSRRDNRIRREPARDEQERGTSHVVNEPTTDLREDQLRQHIGPAVKELREREGWSLRDLGARCGVSSAYLSRIERGSSVPSFSILAAIASAFRVSPEYFIEFERSARELESALAYTLEQLAVPRSTWHEFADLSMEAQGAIVESFKRMTMPLSDEDVRHHDAEAMILADGVDASLERLIGIAKKDGLPPVDFARHRTQIEESTSDRFVMINRLCTLPASWLFDQLEVFRGTFGIEPEDPLLLKWWVRAQRSALLRALDGSISRSIYPMEAVSRYIRTGSWGNQVQFKPNVVREHVAETVKLLRSSHGYQIGLYDDDVPVRLIGKAASGVLFITPDDPAARANGAGEGMALRFSSPETTIRFQDFFNTFWDQIPDERRANEAVAEWFEHELKAGFAG